jgi:hypothetical protein
MAIHNLLDYAESRLLDMELFFRYFDLSDLELLGVKPVE